MHSCCELFRKHFNYVCEPRADDGRCFHASAQSRAVSFRANSGFGFRVAGSKVTLGFVETHCKDQSELPSFCDAGKQVMSDS